MEGNRCTGADSVVCVLGRFVAGRGAPEHLRMDNGPELIGGRYGTGPGSRG